MSDRRRIRRAIPTGGEGLAHPFLDRRPASEFVDAIGSSGAFLSPPWCLYEGMKQFVGTERGRFDGPGGSTKLRNIPEGKSLVLNLGERK